MVSELDSGTLCLFLAPQLEVLAPFEGQLCFVFAHGAF